MVIPMSFPNTQQNHHLDICDWLMYIYIYTYILDGNRLNLPFGRGRQIVEMGDSAMYMSSFVVRRQKVTTIHSPIHVNTVILIGSMYGASTVPTFTI